MKGLPGPQGLYDPAYEHDACGVGFICHIKGKASHSIVVDALEMLERMNHRGGGGGETASGDGAGILVKMPDGFLREKCAEIGITLPKQGQYAMGMVFLPRDPADAARCQAIFERIAREYEMVVLGWRDVPVDHTYVGRTPRKTEPKIRQVFLGMGEHFFMKADFERRLYLVRQRAENTIEFDTSLPAQAREDFYICVLSANRTVYKGMLTADQLRHYYLDLQDPKFASAIAMVHSRFSTNTFPSWSLAHPFRLIAHNGEINTLRGNRNWMRARYGTLSSDVFGDELQKTYPVLTESGSDSATFDNALQFLRGKGRTLPHSILMMIPEAWQKHSLMSDDLKAFYEYHACLMEPWDGPASVAFTNGDVIGAVLDRNGLRPSRYYVTKDDRVIMASEVGVLPIKPDEVAKKWRLQPGKIFLVDMKQGRIVDDREIKDELVDKRPWRRWIDENMINLDALPTPSHVHQPDHDTLLVRQHAFGYTTEDVKLLLTPMAVGGQEGLGSMGTATPLACLADRPQLLYNYFKQLFAQVTNPPLDANFEALVTSLITYLGREGNLLEESPKAAHLIKLKTPILSNADLAKLREVQVGEIKSITLPML